MLSYIKQWLALSILVRCKKTLSLAHNEHYDVEQMSDIWGFFVFSGKQYRLH